MKRFCVLSVCLGLALACTPDPKPNQVPYVEPRMVGESQLETENGHTLKTLKLAIDSRKTNDIATLMESIVEDGRLVGYKIRFKQNGYQYVYLDILCPDYKYLPVSVVWNEGIPYWTVDGKVFADNDGRTFSAEESQLLFQNRYGGYRFKYDSGSMYKLVCRNDAYLNLSIVKSVSHSDGTLTFTLCDGNAVTMDWQEDFDVIFTDAKELKVVPGNSARINFLTSGAGPSSSVTCTISKGWDAKVTRISQKTGYVIVSAPKGAEPAELTLSLCDGQKTATRTTTVNIGHFYTLYDEYPFSEEANRYDVWIDSDIDFTSALVPASSDWISLVASTSTDHITLDLKKNGTKESRSAVVSFQDVLGNEIKSVSVVQNGVKQYCYEMTIGEFISTEDNSEDIFILRGSPSAIVDGGAMTLTDSTGSVKIAGASNYSAFASRIDESVRVVFRGHKATSGGEAVLADATITNVIDHRHYSAYGWMELPGIDTTGTLEFFHHPMTIDGVEARNYSYYWDYDNLVAHWVAYPLNPWLRGTGSRSDVWGLDPLLPREKQPVLYSTFNNSTSGFNCDRGHQCPSADRYHIQANIETFYGTNMTPQMGALNQQMWANFEAQVRTWSALCDTLYVVTGCTVSDSLGHVLDNDGKHVTVPGHYFKALLAYSSNPFFGHGGYKAAAFYIEHRRYTEGNVQSSMAISVETLESLTGIDFFVNLPSVVGDITAEEIEKEDPSSGFWF